MQDGSVLQTVTGLGSVLSTNWIPNMGVAVCFGRSKVIKINKTHLKKLSWLHFFLNMLLCYVFLPGYFADLLHSWMDQSESSISFLSHGPPEPEHLGSKSGTLFGCLSGKAAFAAAGAIQLWAGHCWNRFIKVCVSLSCEVTLCLFSYHSEPCSSRWPASPQCLPAEPGLLGCGPVDRETFVPPPATSAPQQLRFRLLPDWMELACFLCHHCSDCWGHCQWYSVSRVVPHVWVSGAGGCWKCQSTGELWHCSSCYCLLY